jgi:hypothetical protein
MTSQQADPAAIRADIERTRAELGDTVQALAAKVDVKARAREALARRPGAAVAIAGLAAGITALVVLLGRRTGRRRARRRRSTRRG